ncbi:hypothetical protein OG559_05935 [Micromonospora sp. NBC_01405]|uniref:hypothetical protein n=1 Tax=Micromonospora sp. NBC_01405 TaxID=2903589 RepID=UPI00324B8EC4
MKSNGDWIELVGAIGLFAALLALIIVLLTQVGAWMRARVKLARETEYRQLVERVVQGQEALSRQIGEVNDSLSDMRRRIDKIETVLKQVE